MATVTIIPERLAELDRITLEYGNHEPGSHYCVMEAAAYVAGEPWSDSPACVSHVIAAFLRSWNDWMDDADRQMLKPLIPAVIGTAGSARAEHKRGRLALDWLVRTNAPAFLRLAGLTNHADALASLQPITTPKRLTTAGVRLHAAGDAAWAAARAAAWDAAGDAARAAAGAAARDAAWDAARAAAGDAARDAAWDAAWDAVGAAAGDAAWAAAWAAAGAAAWDAAWDAAGDAAGAAARAAAGAAAGDAAREALRPTVVELQASALELVERLVAIT